MKLKDLLMEGDGEKRKLSSEVKKHFLEIVSTYNKYQEMMDRKSDITEIAETLGGITEAARTLAIHEGDDWFDKHTVKRNMSELDKLGKQFDKVALEAKALDQRMAGLYEDMGHILSRYYKIGEISEDQMKERLGLKESTNCGCGCNGTTPGGCMDSVKEQQVQVVNRTSNGNFVINISEDEMEEGAEDAAKAIIPGAIKAKLQKAMDVLDGKNLSYQQKIKVLGKVVDSLGIDKKDLQRISQKIKTKLESKIEEDGKMKGGADDPCWKGYEMVGMKKGKNGNEVPNCVPKK